MIPSVSALFFCLALALAASSAHGQAGATPSVTIVTPTADSCTALGRKSLDLDAVPIGLPTAAVEARLGQTLRRIREASDVTAMLACIMRRSR
jgi:hypothetical protein